MHEIDVTSGEPAHARHSRHAVRVRVLVRHGRRAVSVRAVRHAGHVVERYVTSGVRCVATDATVRRHAALIVGRWRQARAEERRIYLAGVVDACQFCRMLIAIYVFQMYACAVLSTNIGVI